MGNSVAAATGMEHPIEDLALLAIAALLLLLAAVRLLKRFGYWRRHRFQPLAVLRDGARLVSKARYRGRKVFHYSNGVVVGETKLGFRQFDSFDAYRQYVDQR